jgi:hypothetical protein
MNTALYIGESNPKIFDEVIDRCVGFDQENEHHELDLDKHMIKTAKLLENESAVLKLAGRYHDIGKLETKTFNKKDGTQDSNAHYYGHHNVGAYEFMVMGLATDMRHKPLIEICSLINFHMRPYDIERAEGKGEKKFIGIVGREFYDKLMKLHEADKAAH